MTVFYWGDSSWAFPFLENKPMTILQIRKLLHHSQGYNQYTFVQKYRIWITVVWTGSGLKCWPKEEDKGACVKISVRPGPGSQWSWGAGGGQRGQHTAWQGRGALAIAPSSWVGSGGLFWAPLQLKLSTPHRGSRGRSSAAAHGTGAIFRAAPQGGSLIQPDPDPTASPCPSQKGTWWFF